MIDSLSTNENPQGQPSVPSPNEPKRPGGGVKSRLPWLFLAALVLLALIGAGLFLFRDQLGLERFEAQEEVREELNAEEKSLGEWRVEQIPKGDEGLAFGTEDWQFVASSRITGESEVLLSADGFDDLLRNASEDYGNPQPGWSRSTRLLGSPEQGEEVFLAYDEFLRSILFAYNINSGSIREVEKPAEDQFGGNIAPTGDKDLFLFHIADEEHQRGLALFCYASGERRDLITVEPGETFAIDQGPGQQGRIEWRSLSVATYYVFDAAQITKPNEEYKNSRIGVIPPSELACAS
ncbi:MAG: hypothetical protein WD850_02290 [Candidatus Spechtbacterales bacterium]